MSKISIKTIGCMFIVSAIIVAMFSFIVPIKSEVAYTAKLTKIEYVGGIRVTKYYYFSNGRVESDLVIRNIKIGGNYKVIRQLSLIGLRLFTKTYLI